MADASGPQIAVVGAGIAGLSCARQLRARGARVAVFEAADRPGGVLGTTCEDGYIQEHAANAFLPAPDGAAALAAELGVAMADADPAAKHRWIVRGGRLHALPTSPLQAITTRLISWRGKLSALGEPLRRARPHARYGDETVAAFARRRLGTEVAEAVVGPFVTGVFAGEADALSLQAAFPILAELEERGGLLRGMLSRQIARKRARRGKPRSAGERAAGRRQRPRLAAPLGGAQALIDALAADLGAALRTGCPVRAIEPAAGARGGVSIVVDSGDGDGARERFDAAVLAIPAHTAAEIARRASPPLAGLLADIPYAAAAIVHLGFARADIAHPLDGFGFLVAKGEDPRVLGCVFESSLWPNRAPAGFALLRCIYGGVRDPDIMELGDDALIDQARADLGQVLGVTAAPVHRRVIRWPRAIPQYPLGHRGRVERADELAASLGVALAGSAYRGVAVNAIVADARRVADRALALAGAGGDA